MNERRRLHSRGQRTSYTRRRRMWTTSNTSRSRRLCRRKEQRCPPKARTRLRLVANTATDDAERAADRFLASMPQHDQRGLAVARDAYILGWLDGLAHSNERRHQ